MTYKNIEFKELVVKTRRIKASYDLLNRTEGHRAWSVSEYMQGLFGDIGDLSKLVMAKKGFRFAEKDDLNNQLAQELADCLWSIIVIADELDIDLEKQFMKTMNKLERKVSERKVIKSNKSKTI